MPPFRRDFFESSTRFEQRKHLGTGGFGAVHEVFDRKRNAVVALKILRDPAANQIYQFKQEFRSLSGITHPNLVSLYELGSDDGQWFFTMELVEGCHFLDFVGGNQTGGGSFTLPTPEQDEEPALPDDLDSTRTDDALPAPLSAASPLATLTGSVAPLPGAPVSAALPAGAVLPAAARHAAAPLPPSAIARLVDALRQLTGGLQALHQAGKVHRDVKPSNVLCTPQGRVVILDFGIVMDLVEGETTRNVAGTPFYMAPEQALEKDISPAADWYSVGVMLYQALTGSLPFSGSALQVIQQKALLDPPPPSRLRPGVPPALDGLCMRLLSRRPELRPGAAEILATLDAFREQPGSAEASREPPERSPDAPFVGRDGHLAALLKAHEESRQGKTVVALCRGVSGIGKSTLCKRFLKEISLREGRTIALSGRCYEHEDVPFKALDGVVDALSRLLRRRPADASSVIPRDISSLARLFPVLLQVPAFEKAPRRRVVDDVQVRQVAFAALREMFLRVSDRWPLVIHIDDLQWGDLDSVSLLLDVLRPPDPPPLLLLLSYRSDEEASSAVLGALRGALQGELARSVVVHDVPVGELSSAEAEALVRALQPGVGVAQAASIAAEARGNAFFVAELSRAPSQAGGAATLDEVLRARAARLPEEPRRLLELVATAGHPIPREVVSGALGGLPGASEPQALAQLRAARLIRVRLTHDAAGEASEELVAYHDRVREAVVAGLAPEALADLHLRLGRALEASGKAEPEQLVVHLLRGGDAEGAARHAAEASAQSERAMAYHQTARLCQIALDTGKLAGDERRAVESRLADALTGVGRPRQAAEAYLALAGRVAGAEALRLQRQAARQFFIAGHIEEGRRVLARLSHVSRIGLPRTTFGLLLSALFYRALLLLRGLEFRERKEADVPPALLLRVDTCDVICAATSDALLAMRAAMMGLWYALQAGEPVRVAHSLANAIPSFFVLGEPPERVARALSQAVALAERVGDPYAIGHTRFIEGYIDQLEGRWKLSCERIESARQILRDECFDALSNLDFADLIHAYSLRWMGALPRLAAGLPPLLKSAAERGNQSQEGLLQLVAGFLLPLRDGDPGAALALVDTARAHAEGQGAHMPYAFSVEASLLILLYQGQGAEARRVRLAQHKRLAATGVPRLRFFETVWSHLDGLVTLAAGDPPAAAEKLARKLLRGGPRFAAPSGTSLLALVRRRQGKHDEAVALARQADELLTACDMPLHAAAIRLRCGQWTGGEEGERLVQDARGWMRSQGIRDPDRMANLFAPDEGGATR